MAGVTSYPSGVQYRESFYDTSLAFRDPDLRGGEPVLDPLGMPKAISGNFASVFTVNGTDGRRWAVKCFTRHVPDQDLRYEQISRALAGVRSSWKVGFQYLPDGVLCQGARYPALKMEWVEATGLLPYVEQHLTDRDTLGGLAGKFSDLVRDLSRQGIAHGDLQHGNILVTSSGEMKLVDYDGMFVPGLYSLGASEKGHANYQSPLRTMASWGPDIDRFSSWVIYASLSALTLDPMLWQALHADGDEALLFHQADFSDRDNSRARYAFANSSVPRLREIADDIDFLWAPDLTAIPPLETIVAPGSSQPAQGAAPVYESGATGTDWLRQHQAVAGLTSQLSASHYLALSPPRRSIRVTSAVLLCLVVLCTVVRVLNGLDPVLVLIIWTVTFVSYRSTPERRERQRSYKVFRQRRSAAAKARARTTVSEREASKLVQEAGNARVSVERKAGKARADEQREISGVNKKLDREIESLNGKIGALQTKEAAEVAKALQPLQRAHIDERMRATRVAGSGVTGVGPAIAASLAAKGIVTAADIAGVRVTTNARGSSVVAIVRRNGTAVSVRGVGQQRAYALNAWRQSVETRARTTQPTVLPQAQRQQIADRYVQQKHSLENDQAASRARAALEINSLHRKWATAQQDIANELREATARVAALQAKVDQDLVPVRKQSETADWQRDFAKLELDRYRRIRYMRYLGKLATG